MVLAYIGTVYEGLKSSVYKYLKNCLNYDDSLMYWQNLKEEKPHILLFTESFSTVVATS